MSRSVSRSGRLKSSGPLSLELNGGKTYTSPVIWVERRKRPSTLYLAGNGLTIQNSSRKRLTVCSFFLVFTVFLCLIAKHRRPTINSTVIVSVPLQFSSFSLKFILLFFFLHLLFLLLVQVCCHPSSPAKRAYSFSKSEMELKPVLYAV